MGSTSDMVYRAINPLTVQSRANKLNDTLATLAVSRTCWTGGSGQLSGARASTPSIWKKIKLADRACGMVLTRASD